MSVTYNTVLQEVANLFGQVKGATAVDVAVNYGDPQTASTLRGPMLPTLSISDAVFGTIMDIITAIAESPLHAERGDFATVTGTLANLAAIPRTVGGLPVLGVPLWVKDASDNIACLPMSLDRVRSFNRFSGAGSVYATFSPYAYCINDGRIEHTRASVIMNVVAWSRPIATGGNIPLADHHEWAVVNGAAMRLAAKEGGFRALHDQCKAYWDNHIATIRGYTNQAAYGQLQSAPASL